MTNFYQNCCLVIFCLIFFYNPYSLTTIAIKEDESILGIASNGKIMVVALPRSLMFYSIDPNNNETAVFENFNAIQFSWKYPENNLEFELLPDNRFVLCWTFTCRSVFIICHSFHFLAVFTK